MNFDQDIKPFDGKEIINTDGNVISGNVSPEEKSENMNPKKQ